MFNSRSVINAPHLPSDMCGGGWVILDSTVDKVMLRYETTKKISCRVKHLGYGGRDVMVKYFREIVSRATS